MDITIISTGILTVTEGSEEKSAEARFSLDFEAHPGAINCRIMNGDRITKYGVIACIDGIAAGIVALMHESRKDGHFTNQEVMDMLKVAINLFGSAKVHAATCVRERLFDQSEN